MLIEFSVTNFLSYKDKVTFSMLASNTGGLNDNYVTIDSKNILKTAAIYGANASGKTNLFKILTNIIIMIRRSNNVDPSLLLPITPFVFDKKSAKSPSEFEIKYISKGIKYVYGFKADSKEIYEEYLYYYPNGRESLIFDRNNGDNEYPREDKKMLEDISKKTPKNRFFLSSAANWNNKKCEDAFYFFDKTINTYLEFNVLQEAAKKRYYKDISENGKLKDFALDCLHSADLNIVDFKPFEVDVPKEVYAPLLNNYIINNEEDMKAYGVLFKHKNSDVNIDFSDESKGTQMLFTLIPYLYEAVNDGAVLIVDELDKSLHPELVEMIVNIFNDKRINKGNAQLIFNTHDTGLLKQSLFRKDQIWFIEKNNETGISNLKLLADYKIKPTENYEKNYRAGVYGATPDINNKINLSYVIGEEKEFYK